MSELSSDKHKRWYSIWSKTTTAKYSFVVLSLVTFFLVQLFINNRIMVDTKKRIDEVAQKEVKETVHAGSIPLPGVEEKALIYFDALQKQHESENQSRIIRIRAYPKTV